MHSVFMHISGWDKRCTYIHFTFPSWESYELALFLHEYYSSSLFYWSSSEKILANLFKSHVNVAEIATATEITAICSIYLSADFFFFWFVVHPVTLQSGLCSSAGLVLDTVSELPGLWCGFETKRLILSYLILSSYNIYWDARLFSCPCCFPCACFFTSVQQTKDLQEQEGGGNEEICISYSSYSSLTLTSGLQPWLDTGVC